MQMSSLVKLRRAAGVTVLVTALAITGRLAEAETLADALVGAYNHSGLLEQQRAVLRAADEDVAAAASALKPVLRWTADLTQSYREVPQLNVLATSGSSNSLTASINLIAEVLVYDFGASAFRVEATKETVLATRDTLLNVEQQILLRAVSAYMGVIEASEFVALRQNNVRLLTQELRAARDRFEVGEVTRTDVALAEAQLANARSGLAAAQGTLLRAQEEYRTAVGRKPGRLSGPPSLPTIGGDIQAAKALAVRQHPLLRSAQHQVAAAELLIRSNEAAMAPRVTLNGSVGVSEEFGGSDFNRNASVGLGVNQTIYQGGRLSSDVRRSMAQRDAQRANLHVVRFDVEQAVGDAYASFATARAQLEASERQIRAARIAFRGVREEATLGARTTLDVLDAEQSLLDAQSTQVSARASLYIAAYSVLSATGRLTAAHLGLPVQIYDPAGYYNLVKDSPAKNSRQGRQLDRVLRALQKD
ncbi:Outer membrane efflux protein BepC precursor [Sulfitobacter sp. THAF37]|uniref:TolC family outer membrane protein n=1 Tax=Sulfitobacter sp. THAF37 TaxID=2587855 RepID=UPI0012694706|nr:TolC family outer membrane protein [Sulfitobacter sp. THAF37]QFT59191.1 Outer membrane efflux protein BepC precursor [Sulfitobacter sp. THAF37]